MITNVLNIVANLLYVCIVVEEMHVGFVQNHTAVQNLLVHNTAKLSLGAMTCHYWPDNVCVHGKQMFDSSGTILV